MAVLERVCERGSALDLRQLHYFIVTTRLKSMSRAAEEIPVRVSAVSQAISELEKELGLSLLVRNSRGVQTTLAGELLAEHAERVFSELAMARRRLASYRGVKGSVVLGKPAVLGVAKLPLVLAHFRRDYPSIEVRLVEANTRELILALRSRDVDIALLTNPPDCGAHDLETLEIERAETGIVLAPNHPLASAERLDLVSLAETPVIVLPTGHALRDILMDVCERAGIRPRIAFETGVSEMLCALVRAGVGFSLQCRSRAIAMGLSFVRCNPPPLERIVCLAWVRGRQPTPEAVLLRDRIREGWS